MDSVDLIHSDLAAEAYGGLVALQASWKKYGHIKPFMVIWPSKTIRYRGEAVNDRIPFMLPEDLTKRTTHINKIRERTCAWASLVCEQHEKCVLVTFESPVGTVAWKLPITNSGLLGDPVVA